VLLLSINELPGDELGETADGNAGTRHQDPS
jgi:hypothetical protein